MNKSNKVIAVMSVVLLLAVFAVTRCFMPTNEERDRDNIDIEERPQSAKEDTDRVVIAIDAGHGGVDPGKVGVDGQLEKDINLEIAKKLKEILERDEDTNFEVMMTRESDMGYYSESDANKKMADMKKRCSMINNSNAKLLVSIHQNSYHSPSVKGAQVFYYKNSKGGNILANKIQKNLVADLVPNGKGRVEKSNDNYYLLLNVSCPAVIVECGFLSNSKEAALLTDDTYQNRVATAIAKGIREYLIDN